MQKATISYFEGCIRRPFSEGLRSLRSLRKVEGGAEGWDAEGRKVSKASKVRTKGGSKGKCDNWDVSEHATGLKRTPTPFKNPNPLRARDMV